MSSDSQGWMELGLELMAETDLGSGKLAECVEQWLSQYNKEIKDEKVKLWDLVTQGGYPNTWGAQIPVQLNWNLELMDSLLMEYEDREVITWLRYGWPVSRLPNWTESTPTFVNHDSALDFPEEIGEYLRKEISRGAVCGPFDSISFDSRIGVSPLSTRPKKDSQDRWIIMDLSWPPGRSVNSGIAKDQFMGFKVHLRFPTIDAIAKRVAELEGPVLLFKVDLSGYFRQLPLDPADYSLMCFVWENRVYFDVVSPMGLRSAPYFAQRTSNAIRFIHNRAGYYLFNYINDFIGVENIELIWNSFHGLITLLKSLGVTEASKKRIELISRMNCVGTMVDAEKGTMEVLPKRIQELQEELESWMEKKTCKLKDVQRLVGKLQFVCTVVRPGRLFMARMLDLLRMVEKNKEIRITEECRLDIVRVSRGYTDHHQGRGQP